MQTAVFSIISPNYRHFARVLMASARRHHPDWDRFVLIVGETSASSDGEELFAAVPLAALQLPDPRRFCFRYTLLELNTAVKPWMFEYLFERSYDRVVYLDPDIFIYSPLIELDLAPPGTFMTLTPHLTGSIGGDLHPSERTILQAGSYNLGFLAVSRHQALGRFLAWWKEKLEFQCVVDVEHGLFVDQKWMELAPSLFPDVAILRHDGYNVAYWNLRQRTVIGDGPSATVNGQPLRFFHFSGVDPAIPTLVSNKDTRMKITDVGDAGTLVETYLAALLGAGYASFRKAPYAFGVFSDGSPISDFARFLYRGSEKLQAECGPDPFGHPELFVGIRDYRKPPLIARVGVASYRALSRARPLVRLVPRAWRTAMRDVLLQRRGQKASAIVVKSSLSPGLDVVGYFGRETGVGESARLCLQACERAGLPNHFIDVDRRDGLTQRAVHRASVYHVNADQIPAVHDKLRNVFDSSLYNIGCWHWELPELPDEWIASAEPLDEIWAPSSFIQSAISRKVTIPVIHMPHGIEVETIEACSPEEFGVPRGRFTFLCMFDLASGVDRKNPVAAIEAFRRAFPDESSRAALLIKAGSTAGTKVPTDLGDLVRGIPNVFLADRMLSRGRVGGLISSCDATLSLHRSEGFGLILAESMYLGKPVVATGWSGNMDFMNGGNSCPVDYELVTIDRNRDDYTAGQQWAEPDVDHAAYFMRRLLEDSAWRAAIGQRASDTIRSNFSPEAAGLRYRRRLELLGLMEPEG